MQILGKATNSHELFDKFHLIKIIEAAVLISPNDICVTPFMKSDSTSFDISSADWIIQGYIPWENSQARE